MSDDLLASRARGAKTLFFALGHDEEGEWYDSVPEYENPRTHFPDTIGADVDFADYFRGAQRSKRSQLGPYHVLESRLAPSFVLPRHHHSIDQLVLILDGELRQGNRSFGAGDGYYSPAFTPYANSAGPEGVRFVEVRKDPIETIETWWDEDRPERWLRSVWTQS
jgi:hypothetical protein